MDDKQFGMFLERAVNELQTKQDRLRSDYNLGGYTNWWFDQETASLQFRDDAGTIRRHFDIIPIGSLSKSTWQWAWANSNIVPKLRKRAARLKDLGRITGGDIFVQEKPFAAEEAWAWEFAAVAVMHLNALGCYRTDDPKNDLYIFLALINAHGTH